MQGNSSHHSLSLKTRVDPLGLTHISSISSSRCLCMDRITSSYDLIALRHSHSPEIRYETTNEFGYIHAQSLALF
jgi:hypothetical protein